MLKRNILINGLGALALMCTSCGGGNTNTETSSGDKKTVETKEPEKVVERNKENITYKIATDNTKVLWQGRKVYQEDYSHNGVVPVSQGELYVKGENLTGGNFTINMTDIADHDLKGSPEDSAKLVKHLKSDDFFYAEEYPNAKFEITSVKPLEGNPDATHTIAGNLTLRGTTKNIEFPAKVQMKDDVITARANFTIDRTRWNITYGAESTFEELTDKLKDKVIADDINLDIELKAKKKAMASAR